MKSPYEVLGLSQNASDEEITNAYRRLAKIYHPDVNPNASEMFIQINKAYNSLKNKQFNSFDSGIAINIFEDIEEFNTNTVKKEFVFEQKYNSYVDTPWLNFINDNKETIFKITASIIAIYILDYYFGIIRFIMGLF